MKILGNGSKGGDVEKLQTKLNDLGFDVKVDGVFGRDTEGAVKKLQTLFNYTVDGRVGDGTNGLIDAQLKYGWNAKDPDAADKAAKANPTKK